MLLEQTIPELTRRLIKIFLICNYQFYSIIVDEVTDVLIMDGLINITLKITSEQFKDNDESTISKKQDTWTFQKKINSNSPIWLLSST